MALGRMRPNGDECERVGPRVAKWVLMGSSRAKSGKLRLKRAKLAPMVRMGLIGPKGEIIGQIEAKYTECARMGKNGMELGQIA